MIPAEIIGMELKFFVVMITAPLTFTVRRSFIPGFVDEARRSGRSDQFISSIANETTSGTEAVCFVASNLSVAETGRCRT